jgi:aspartate beta-hydroxylase
MEPETVPSLVARARALLSRKDLDGALAAFRRVLAIDPDHVEALDTAGAILLARGDVVGAVRHCERAVELRPGDPDLHAHLGTAHISMLKSIGCEDALAAICRDLPRAYTSLLHFARLRELAGDAHAALVGYTRALATAHALGFWESEDATPPWLRAAVAHAREVSRKGKRDLFARWLEAAQKKHGKGEMKRVAECMAMYLGTKPTVYADPRQQPSFLYFPGLPIAPVFPRDALPFADWYEAEADAIREEALRVLGERAGDIQPFHFDVPEDKRATLTTGDWDAYFFYDEGERLDDHHAACPRTSSALDRLPLDRVPAHGPEVCFSIMRPKAHILPHRGVTNTRSVLHLGLVIPEGCALNLPGIEEVHWSPGKCFAFDDTYLHEAWNRSDTTRVVLLGDIWNPYLTLPEREAVRDLVCAIGAWNVETEPALPRS